MFWLKELRGQPQCCFWLGKLEYTAIYTGSLGEKMCRNNVMASFEWSVLSYLVEKLFALKVKWHKDITYLADNRHLLNFPQQWSPARRLLVGQKHRDRRGNLGYLGVGSTSLSEGSRQCLMCFNKLTCPNDSSRAKMVSECPNYCFRYVVCMFDLATWPSVWTP